MISYGHGLAWVWAGALTPRLSAPEQVTKFALALARGEPNREQITRTVLRIQFVNLSKVGTNSVTSVWAVPLGQTPGYLDPQSQEALHEVDVSGTTLHFSFGQAPEGEAVGTLG
jgi:hypothetical protein